MINDIASDEDMQSLKVATDKLNAVLDARGVKMHSCGVCGEENSFFIADGYAVIAASPVGNVTTTSGLSMPLLPLCCTKCGNTVFLNALTLGLGNDLFGKEPQHVGN